MSTQRQWDFIQASRGVRPECARELQQAFQVSKMIRGGNRACCGSRGYLSSTGKLLHEHFTECCVNFLIFQITSNRDRPRQSPVKKFALF